MHKTEIFRRRSKSFLDLPQEILSLILSFVYDEHGLRRGLWATKARATARSVRDWLLPAAYSPRLNLVRRDMWSLTACPYTDIWELLEAFIRPECASSRDVLVTDSFELSSSNFSLLLALLSKCKDLNALGLSKLYMAARLCRIDFREGRGTPWTNSHESAPLKFFPDGHHSNLSTLSQLQRIVLMDVHVPGFIYRKEWPSLFVNPSTSIFVCPELTSLCLIVTNKQVEVPFYGTFVAAMVDICILHELMRHLEIYLQHLNPHCPLHFHDPTKVQMTCSDQMQSQIKLLRDIVTRAQISVSLHHQVHRKFFASPDMTVSHYEDLGSHHLRMLPIQLIAQRFWSGATRDLFNRRPDNHIRGMRSLDVYPTIPTLGSL